MSSVNLQKKKLNSKPFFNLYKISFTLITLILINACGGGSKTNADTSSNSASLATTIAFEESELKNTIWVTPAVLTKNHYTDTKLDHLLQIMIFDGDELIIRSPEASSGQYKFKWKKGDRGQIHLKDLDPESSSGFQYEIWKTQDDIGSFKIISNYFASVGDAEPITFLKPQLLNSNNLSNKVISLESGREIGYFEGHRYKFNIYKDDENNFYGDVSDDRFQQTVLVKTDHSVDRYLLFDGLRAETGTLLKFSYWRVNAENPHIELGAIHRITNLIQADYTFNMLHSDKLDNLNYAAHVYK